MSGRAKQNMRVSPRISRHATDLQYLARVNRAVRNRKISEASTDLIQALVDAAKALIKGKISLTGTQLRRARLHEANFKKLIKPNASVTQRKKTLQTGGFLPAILGPLLKVGLPLVGSLLGGTRRF